MRNYCSICGLEIQMNKVLCKRCQIIQDSQFFDDEKLVTHTETSTCEHFKNGQYFTVNFWIFKKNYFYCEDCLNLISLTGWHIF